MTAAALALLIGTITMVSPSPQALEKAAETLGLSGKVSVIEGQVFLDGGTTYLVLNGDEAAS